MSAFKSIISSTVLAAFSLSAPVHAAGADTRAVADLNTCAKPHYPAESLAAKHEGNVHLSFLVEANGAVQEATIKQSSGHELLDIAARDAIKLCKFRPAMKNGEAVKDWANVRYDWKLK